MKAKRKGWRRFWVVAPVLNAAGLLLILSLTYVGYLDFIGMVQSIFGFTASMIFLYFFFRMIRPVTENPIQDGQLRTVKDIFVSGRQLQEVNQEVYRWINKEGIAIETEREGFVRGRLGTPSGLGLTAPKYFEVSFKPDHYGVVVHTEGWISIFDVSEKSFSKTALTYGGIPRRKGWKVMEHLWQSLKTLSK